MVLWSSDHWLCVPAHGLLELLPGHEAVVLPDLPQRPLELLLVLVLGALRLLLRLGVSSSLPVVQPAGAQHTVRISNSAMPFRFMNLDFICFISNALRTG